MSADTTTLDISKLQRLFTGKQVAQLEDVLFYVDSSGDYYLFDHYKIVRVHDGWSVVEPAQDQPHTWSALKYALCWCIAHRRNAISTERLLRQLDRKLCSLLVDMKIQRRLMSGPQRDLHSVKIHECGLKIASVERQLGGLVDECDRWQTRRFGKSVNLA